MSDKMFQALGTTDEQTICQLCGRSDLKATIALREIETGTVVYYGSECGARAAGWTAREMTAAVKSADDAKAAEARAAAMAAEAARFADWTAWLVQQTGTTDITVAVAALGGFAEARAAYRAR